MTEEYQVITEEVAVDVLLLNGAALKGNLFLHPAAPGHAGREKVEDVLNGPGHFFPLATQGPDAGTVLVNKEQVLFVMTANAAKVATLGADTPTAQAVKVSIELACGPPQTGILYLAQPPGRDRTIDGLNESLDFVCLVQDAFFRFIRRSSIITVREKSPHFASLPPPAP